MIKNIIYLDVDKMYSLSSQIFEGVTEYVLRETAKGSEKSEDQKGPIGSGRVLGDILINQERTSEKKFLNDYSYTIFERKLLEDNRVTTIDTCSENSEEELKIRGNSFVKITGKIVLNDIRSIRFMLENFNKLGADFSHVINHNELSELKNEIENIKKETKDRNLINQLEIQAKKLSNPNALAKAAGLHKDQKFLDSLASILDYGFQDQFEIQMRSANLLFSANLKRNGLREDENLLTRKYSRHSEVSFVLFGVVTQCLKRESFEESSSENLRQQLMNLVGLMSNVESTFTGRLNNEIIIDPIALYTDLI